MFLRFGVILLLLLFCQYGCYGMDVYHGAARSSVTSDPGNTDEQNPMFWAKEARAAIEERLRRRPTGPFARNVVMFLGDGMSVPTLTSARALLGQRLGATGEEARLTFETFPTVGLAKTYCLDAQIADSACTATAYLCGSKANVGTIGVDGAVGRRHCSAASRPERQVHSVATMALLDGRSAGVVSTTRVTHASPAGAYAHSADRDWESDADVAAHCAAPRQPDIADQLVNSFPGNRFKVILGGGRREFLPNTTLDEEGAYGRRLDGRNLIEEWKKQKEESGVSHSYVWNREQLLQAVDEVPEYVLGLFESSHMQYHMEADEGTEPTLAEMTEAAIRVLGRGGEGFFLFVEGGRIDHAHHDNFAQLALDETIEMDRAVARALRLLPEEDSLVVVTADHAHVMSFNGYTHRGNDILGFSDDLADDGLPYLTLSYSNGPGYRSEKDGLREDLSEQNHHDVKFRFPAAVPLQSETHGGDDVAVFARGPHHHMFTGLYEQSQLPHLMAYAACLGPAPHACQPSP